MIQVARKVHPFVFGVLAVAGLVLAVVIDLAEDAGLTFCDIVTLIGFNC